MIYVLLVMLCIQYSGTAMRVTRMTPTMKVDLVGSSAPLGFFDPLGLSKGADAAKLNKYRESELKHGRVAMVCGC